MTLAVLLLLAGSAGQAPEHVFLEVTAERSAYFVHEPLKLSLVFGVETRFAETSMIQPFQRKLDVPVQLVAPWIDGFPGALALAPERAPSAGLIASFVLDDDMALAERAEDRVIDGRTFTVVEIERTFLPTEPGELVIPAALLRFAYATRFEEDFVHGRTPVDRRDALVDSAPLALAIRPLPEGGRPSEFTGAVGRLSVRAEIREGGERGPASGAGVELVLTVEGEGNLELFGAPSLDRIEGFRTGFHVMGKLEEKAPSRRTITYHLAPRGADVREVPPLRFAYFDTTPPAGYRVVETEPIPLPVRPAREAARETRPVAAAGSHGDLGDAAAESSAETASNAPIALVALIAVALVALGGAAFLLARRQRAR